MELDPHVLVALVSATVEKGVPIKSSVPIAQHVAVDDSGHDQPLPVLVPASALGGMEPTFATAPTNPTVPNNTDDHGVDCQVLDAIASVSVSEESNQAVAVTLEVHVAEQVAVLTVAVGSGDGPHMVAHVEGLWRLMRLMSTTYEQLRERVDKTSAVVPGLSIPITKGVELWRTEFIKRVYRYCVSHHHQLFTNEWNGLGTFIQLFKHYYSSLSGDSVDKSKFLNSVYCLRAIRSMVERIAHQQDLTDEEWGDFICMMDTTLPEIESLLHDPTLCESWAASIKSHTNSKPTYAIRRVLGKLTIQHRHIHNLLHFAHSPRSFTALPCKLVVHVIPRHRQVPASLPSTKICWQSLIESVCGDNIIANYTWLREQVAKASAQHCGPGMFHVHAVCSLITHLVTAFQLSQLSQLSSTFTSVSVGVSSPPCAACDAWIQAFNSLGRQQYRTSVTSGDWRFPWVMPELVLSTGPQKAKVSAHMAHRVTAEFVDHWTAKGKLYPASTPPASGKGETTAGLAGRRKALIKTQKWQVDHYGW